MILFHTLCGTAKLCSDSLTMSVLASEFIKSLRDTYVAEHKKDCHLRPVDPLVPWGLYKEIKVVELINHMIQCPLLRSLRFDLYLQKEGVRPAVEVEGIFS